MRTSCGGDRFGSVLRCETRIQPCERARKSSYTMILPTALPMSLPESTRSTLAAIARAIF
jgi:hypothetical protein